ncbi:hypothetical protein BC567DRAFT_231002 [Phyllosticta citribraziliensis]
MVLWLRRWDGAVGFVGFLPTLSSGGACPARGWLGRRHGCRVRRAPLSRRGSSSPSPKRCATLKPESRSLVRQAGGGSCRTLSCASHGGSMSMAARRRGDGGLVGGGGSCGC